MAQVARAIGVGARGSGANIAERVGDLVILRGARGQAVAGRAGAYATRNGAICIGSNHRGEFLAGHGILRGRLPQ